MSADVVQTVLQNSVVLAIPIVWAALGETVCEKTGILNVGIEGVMIIGAFAAAVGLKLGGLEAGVGIAMVAGAISGCALAYLYVTRGADQIVAGIMFTTFALGLTATMSTKWLSDIGELVTFQSYSLPVLGDIPILGKAVFTQTPLGFAAFGAALCVWYLLRRTWFGLYAETISERPAVGEAAGLSVHRLRWIGLIIGCVLVSIGGATLVLDQTGSFVIGETSGQGFIALMVVVLARWSVPWVIAAAGLFGLSTALQFQLQTVSSVSAVPHQAWLALPYVVTIVAVALARKTQYPAAAGLPFKGRVAG